MDGGGRPPARSPARLPAPGAAGGCRGRGRDRRRPPPGAAAGARRRGARPAGGGGGGSVAFLPARLASPRPGPRARGPPERWGGRAGGAQARGRRRAFPGGPAALQPREVPWRWETPVGVTCRWLCGAELHWFNRSMGFNSL